MTEPAVDFQADPEVVESAIHALRAIVADYVDSEDVPTDEQMREAIASFVEKMPPLHRRGWQWIVRTLEMSPLAMGYRRRFSRLSREEQVEVLQRYEKGQNYLQRATVLSLKSVLVMIYFAQPQMERLVGYDHECLLPHGRGGN